ncbi:MAG: hypothetical protein JO097_00995 [Acidobacteriaceae bacterium]|nr:hypothetical protein [Acidobacteriaceae bacterium]MBV9295880.1 hypothetical protein [Acidobacteriaceae bacterium]MBV9764160.1 hypothetical protein [Acidobacteriaceae bacterium]
MGLNRFWIFCFGTALSVISSFAVTPTIGVASAVGTLEVNSAVVNGNANLFDGSQVRTTDASGQILLQNGAALTLAVNSMGTIYKDHLLLQQGVAKADKMNGFTIQAANYLIVGTQPGSQAVVRLKEGSVQVAALNGSLKVFNQKGTLLTRIRAGTASAFQAGSPSDQSGATAGTYNRTKQLAELYTILGGSLVGLGVATDAVLQPVSR